MAGGAMERRARRREVETCAHGRRRGPARHGGERQLHGSLELGSLLPSAMDPRRNEGLLPCARAGALGVAEQREVAWGRKEEGMLLDLKRRRWQPLVGAGDNQQSSEQDSLLAGDGRTTLDAHFWHFPFGIEPGSLQKICSLMYTL
jgi:hypothetical protein